MSREILIIRQLKSTLRDALHALNQAEDAIPFDTSSLVNEIEEALSLPEESTGTSEFSVDSVCNGCQEEKRVNSNHLCADCVRFNDADNLKPNEKGFIEPTIVNGNVTNHLDKLGESLAVLQIKFQRRAVAMENMREMLKHPTKYSIYDLFQEAWGGGYNLNFNLAEQENWK